MAILIVDDETSTRETLRDILLELGHQTILEAKNGEEALRIADHEKSHLHMIISDWEMPVMDGLTLVQKVAEREALDRAPFLLITSDLPKAKLREFHTRYLRMDGNLIKPFRMKALADALTEAYEHRCRTQDTVAFFGRFDPSRLQEAVAANEKGYLKQNAVARSHEELLSLTETRGKTLGALILDPGALDSKLESWLKHFAKTSVGTHLKWVCTSRDPKEVLPLREQCQFFVESTLAPALWLKLLGEIETRTLSAWDLELDLRKAKAAIAEKQESSALKILKQSLDSDPRNPVVLALIGDLYRSQDKKSNAIASYQASLESNPCQPHAYVRLLELTPDPATAEAAARFCPQNLDVLVSAARALSQAREPARARALLEQVLRADPKNPLAQELLASLPC